MGRWNDIPYRDIRVPGLDAYDNFASANIGSGGDEQAVVEALLAKQARELEEQQKRQRASQETRQPQQQSSQPMPGLGFLKSIGGQSGAASGASGAGASSAGGASGGGLGSSIASAGPWALLAAAIVANEANAKHEGRRENDRFPGETALLGRALYEDKDHLRKQGNKIIPGLGEDINIAGNFSSPLDLLDGDTWDSAWKSLKSGGPVVGIFKELFD